MEALYSISTTTMVYRFCCWMLQFYSRTGGGLVTFAKWYFVGSPGCHKPFLHAERHGQSICFQHNHEHGFPVCTDRFKWPSRALKERSQEVQALQNEVDRLQSKDRLAEGDQMLNKLNMANTQITQLTHENNTLKGNNAQLLKQIEGLQDQAFDEQYCVDPQAIAPTPKQAKPEHKTLKQEKEKPTKVTRIIYVEKWEVWWASS